MASYVCKGAKLKCSFGSDQSDLGIMHPAQPVNIGDNNMANIQDSKPIMNIQPFGQCKSLANPTVASATAAANGKLQEMPCIPNTTVPWMPGNMKVMVKGQPALMDSDKLMCMWAGIIEVSDAGQSKCATGANAVDYEKIELDDCGGFGKLLDIDFSL
jgi:hypothetical protein